MSADQIVYDDRWIKNFGRKIHKITAMRELII